MLFNVCSGCLRLSCCIFFFFKQKTAYEMRISDWSSDVCSSDLIAIDVRRAREVPHDELVEQISDRLSKAIGLIPDVHECIHLEEIGRASCRERVCQYV